VLTHRDPQPVALPDAVRLLRARIRTRYDRGTVAWSLTDVQAVEAVLEEVTRRSEQAHTLLRVVQDYDRRAASRRGRFLLRLLRAV
jgi:hypothetical protein